MPNIKKRGQSSVEFLMIVAVATALLLPATFFFFSYAQGTTSQIASAQINNAGNAIKIGAEEMFGIGPNSWKTIEIRMPDTFIEAGIKNNSELYFTYNTQFGISQSVHFFDRFQIRTHEDCYNNCSLENLTRGVNRIRLESKGSYVEILVR